MHNSIADLRSDTVTQPCPAMRRAMAGAPVGDDAYGEDPSVRELEERMATLCGKEAALFTVTGTMSNQIIARACVPVGQELITEFRYHMSWYESGATAAAGAALHAVHTADGFFGGEDLEAALHARPRGPLYARPTLCVLEQPVSALGGRVVPEAKLASTFGVARDNRIHLHLDGARIWHASLAQGIPLEWYGRHCDTMALCFAKGLGAPMGSVIVGDRGVIAECRRWRKMLGGGMHQGGGMAKAALWGLEHHLERLREDHFHAQVFADLIREIPGIELLCEKIDTNCVLFTVDGFTAKEFCNQCAADGILLFPWDARRIRAMTHLGVSREGVLAAYRTVRHIANAPRPLSCSAQLVAVEPTLVM